MQRACVQSTTWSFARSSGTSLPLPVHLCRLLQTQGLQIHGGCGPLTWLAPCAAPCSSGLVKWLREIFVTYGITDELSSDGGPQFTATQHLLSNWCVHHRLSSVALAHSNGRAELGVKTCKGMLMDNTGPNGKINLDKFQRGLLQYRNTPHRDADLSPAQMIFGRPIKDFIPILHGS